MKEILKVKIADTTFAIEQEAYDVLSLLLEEVTKNEGKEVATKIEGEFASQILKRQSINTVIEEGVARDIVLAMGYTPKTTHTSQTPQHTSPTPTNSRVSALGKVFIVCGKILLGIFLAGWVLTAIGILVGFISLIAIGEEWSSMVPIDGISPVVFAGLICAIVVLFMGIVADIGFSLIRSKKINLRGLATAGVIWLIFFLWLIFTGIRNADKWAEWAYQTEAQFELWEEEIEAWEERIEGEWEGAVLNLQGSEEWDSTYTLYFEGLEGAMRFDSFCDRFEELEPYEDRLESHLLRGKKVEVTIDNHYEGDRLYRTITITSPDGDTVVTSPVRILNTSPQVTK